MSSAPKDERRATKIEASRDALALGRSADTLPIRTFSGTPDSISVATPNHLRMLNQQSERRGVNAPQLLVSVRSAAEAILAIQGGAEILDVKEPTLGSLGMASIPEIEAVVNCNQSHATSLSISVALGEVRDWNSNRTIPQLPEHITFAKLGLSQLRSHVDWQNDWARVRMEFQIQTTSRLNWVAVAYADTIEADSPSWEDIFDSAVKMNCSGLLIDTWTKDGRTLLDEMSPETLKEIADKCHTSGLFLALAGRLSQLSLNELIDVPADIIAIRSAACSDANRTAELDPIRVSKFRDALRQFKI